MVFPVVMYGCESWTIKKAECRRTDAFELWCWRRLLRVPWTARRSSQSINPKGNQPRICIRRTDAEAEASVLWPPDANSQLIGKDFDAGKDSGPGEMRGNRGWVGWMASVTQWTWIWANSGRQWRKGKPSIPQFMGLQRVRQNWVTELNWTEPPSHFCM